MNEKDRFYNYVLSFLNIPYKWGGNNPLTGFDCSGLTQELLSYFGMDPAGDQTANDLYQHFQMYGQKSKPDLGVLLFFGTTFRVIHVAMALDDYRMIEAGGGGSNTVDLESAKKQDAFIRVRPISHRKDLVEMIKPKGLPW